MATAYKVLGQSAPAATTNTDVYVASTAGGTVVSTLAIANRSSTPTTARVAIRQGGLSITNSQYIVYDTIIPGNNTLFLTIGIALANTDVVTVYAGAANLSFSLFGSEIS